MNALENYDQFQFENILFPQVNLKNTKEYLGYIYNDLITRGNFPNRCNETESLTLFAFQDYLQLPLIISEKVFRALDTRKKHYLTRSEFIEGLWILYYGKLEHRFSLLFKILDFNHDGILEIEDITLLLYHFHLISHDSHMKPLNDLIKSSMNNQMILSMTTYLDMIKVINSDVFILFLVYIAISKPYKEECVEYFGKEVLSSDEVYSNGSFSKRVSSFHVVAPSENLVKYLREYINVQPQARKEMERELECLNDFEDDVKCSLSTFSKKIAYANVTSTPNCIENVNIGFCGKLTNFFNSHHYLDVSSSTPRVSVISKYPFFIVSKEENFCASKFNNENINHYKLILVHDNLFYFRYCNTTKSYVFSGIHVIKLSYLDRCLEVSSSMGKLYPVQLTSFLGSCVHSISFFFSNEKDAQTFFEVFNRSMNLERRVQDEYDIADSVGKGKYGQIRLARHKQTKETVALKIIKKDQMTKEYLDVLRYERSNFKLLQKLDHPGIVKAKECYESARSAYFIFEYIPGGTLSNYIHTHFATEECLTSLVSLQEIKNLAVQLSEALSFLHGFGIVHRDIKPENILLHFSQDRTVVLKLIDFGLSRVLGFDEKAVESCGTLSFSAPEIASQLPHDRSIDIWSLGVVLYYLRYSRLPFEDCSTDKLKRKIRKVKYEFPFDIDQNVNITSSVNCSEIHYQIRSAIKDCLHSHCENRRSLKEILLTLLY